MRGAVLQFLFAICAFGAVEADVHAIHREKLGMLTCSLCHVPAARGSVMLKRPGHDQCRTCHQAAFEKSAGPVCAQCHTGVVPSASDVAVQRRVRGIPAGFSHARHVDSKSRVDPMSGFRADCTFCHRFAPGAAMPITPSHAECAKCHSRPGIRPRLTASIAASDCQGCHTPGRPAQPHAYPGIAFSHASHFASKADCTVCHANVLRSNTVAEAQLPRMLDCAVCHQSAKTVAAAFRMSNCRTCHVEASAVEPRSRGVRPTSHTESFRLHHEHEASAAGAQCFACHENISPSAEARTQCVQCHQTMRPMSHTARWKDDIHGRYAAIDRITCATCHTADYCVRCHNELPRSHAPLPLFKAGGHARAAMLDQRACMTCHTFENTCASCHTRGVAGGFRK